MGCDRFAQGDSRHEELNAYARQCGQVLARLHARANAPAILGAVWSPHEAARAAVEFAEKYGAQVESDQKAFAVARGQAAKDLGIISPGG